MTSSLAETTAEAITDPLAMTIEERNEVMLHVLHRYFFYDPLRNRPSIQHDADFQNAQDRDDFFMDVVERTLRQPPRALVEYGDPAAANWLTAVLKHKRIDAQRAQARHERILGRLDSNGRWIAGEVGQLPEEHWLHTKARSAEAQFLRREEDRDIWRRICKLPRRLRCVAALRYEEDTIPEIAHKLKISARTVTYRLHEIRQPRLRKVLHA